MRGLQGNSSYGRHPGRGRIGHSDKKGFQLVQSRGQILGVISVVMITVGKNIHREPSRIHVLGNPERWQGKSAPQRVAERL